MKIVIGEPGTGKTYQAELAKEKEGQLVGMKIGDKLDGAVIGAGGYEFEITGGSDMTGTPMRRDVTGSKRSYLILSSGAGIRPQRKGERRRKAVRGNVISPEIVQLNTKVSKAGEKKLEELFPHKPKEEGKK